MVRSLSAFNHPKVTTFLSSFQLFLRSRTISIQTTNPSHHKQFESFVRDRCKSGNLGLDEALNLFIRLINSRPLPSVYPFTQLLGFFVKMKCYPTVLSMSQMMDSQGIQSDIVTYTILINCYCQMGRTDLGFGVVGRVLKCGFRPNSFTLSTLLKGLSKEGKVDQLMELFANILEYGYPCTHVTYGVAIDGLCKIVNARAGLRLMRVMETRNFRPDIHIYSMIISSFSKENLLNEALDLFHEMIGNSSVKVKPNVFTYNSLLHGLCKNGLMNEAEYLIVTMIEKGEDPDTVTYNSLMDGYCLLGRIREAERVFNLMICRGHEPTIVSYSILTNAFCKARRMNKVIQLYKDMMCRGLVPTIDIYTFFIGALCNIRRVSAAMELFKDMLVHGESPNLFTFSTLINGLFSNNCFTEAMKLFRAIGNYGLKPDIVIYTNVIHGLCKVGKVNEAKELFYSLAAKNLQPDIITYGMMIGAFLKEGMMREAEDLSQKLKGNG